MRLHDRAGGLVDHSHLDDCRAAGAELPAVDDLPVDLGAVAAELIARLGADRLLRGHDRQVRAAQLPGCPSRTARGLA